MKTEQDRQGFERHFQRLIAAGRAHPKLQRIFWGFRDHAKDIARDRSAALVGITFRPDDDPDRLVARCYGHSIEFRFSIVAPAHAEPKGLITAIEIDTCDVNRTIKRLGRFEFDDNGVVSPERQDGVGPDIELSSYGFGFWTLLCHCFERALSIEA